MFYWQHMSTAVLWFLSNIYSPLLCHGQRQFCSRLCYIYLHHLFTALLCLLTSSVHGCAMFLLSICTHQFIVIFIFSIFSDFTMFFSASVHDSAMFSISSVHGCAMFIFISISPLCYISFQHLVTTLLCFFSASVHGSAMFLFSICSRLCHVFLASVQGSAIFFSICSRLCHVSFQHLFTVLLCFFSASVHGAAMFLFSICSSVALFRFSIACPRLSYI